MKKLLAVILALITVVSMVSCGKEPADDVVSNNVELEQNAEATPDATGEPEESPEAAPETDATPEAKPDNTPASKPTTNPTDKPAQTPGNNPTAKPTTKPTNAPTAEPTPEAPKTAGNILLADFKAKAASSSSALSIAEGLAGNSIIEFMAGAMPVEPGYLAGFDNVEIKGFKEGAMFAPMIGSIPFIGYVFVLEDGVSTSDFISTLKSNANLRWNICVEAEEMVAGSSGNKVFFVMCNKDLSAE